jgi:D-sedoheptulose 7-phosphate isomerase
MEYNIKEIIKTHISVAEKMLEKDATGEIAKASFIILKCIRNGGTLYTFGNGGSAADAQHFSAELVGRFFLERDGFRSVSLSTDTSILTAVGNDYGFDEVFTRQLRALGRPEDAVAAFSTSGNSPNVLKAVREAKDRGMQVIGFSGNGGGKMRDFCDALIRIPSPSTPRIQEGHVLAYHIICELVEKELSAAI